MVDHFTMKKQSSPAKSKQSHQFRVIAGLHRGRKLSFPAVNHLRPTPDRVRETVFNWLMDECLHRRCLDLCAGSGALGFEALSRLASHCTFIDSLPQVITHIDAHLKTLQITESRALCASLPSAISQLDQQKPFDMVFIDPPYQLAIINDCLEALLDQQLLCEKAWVYVENASADAAPNLASDFALYRQKTFGQVRASLFQYSRLG